MEKVKWKKRIVLPNNCDLKVRLTRLKKGNALRSDMVEGMTDKIPSRGEQVIIWSGTRRVNTSPIVEFKEIDKNSFVLTTENSIYLLEMI